MFPQIVLGEDGGYGTVLEHSALDGPPGVFTNIMTMDFIERYEYHFKIQCILCNNMCVFSIVLNITFWMKFLMLIHLH